MSRMYFLLPFLSLFLLPGMSLTPSHATSPETYPVPRCPVTCQQPSQMTTVPRRAFRAPKRLLSLQQLGLHRPPMTSDPIQQAALHQGRDHVLCIFVQKPVLWTRSCSMNSWVMIKPGSLLWRRGRSIPTIYEPPPTVLPSDNHPKVTHFLQGFEGRHMQLFQSHSLCLFSKAGRIV